MTDPMAAFVLARIVEREKAASAATPGPWAVDPDGLGGANIVGDDDHWVTETMRDVTRVDAIHVALNDPAHVLARCAADRAIVKLFRYADWNAMEVGRVADYQSAVAAASTRDALRQVVQHLANANADHPDFRPEWKL